MSTITGKWSKEHIRSILRNLDKRTGLQGGELPIEFMSSERFLGMYYRGPNQRFAFSTRYFNSPTFPERMAYDVIRHEYAHYVVDATGLTRWVPHGPRVKHHGDDWKLACRLVGANPHRCYDDEAYRFGAEHPICNERDVEILEQALDVPPVDIVGHLAYWDCPPLPEDQRLALDEELRTAKGRRYFTVGQQLLHTQYGFGRVLDTYPARGGQMVRIRFDDADERTVPAEVLLPIIDGKLQLPRRKKR